MARIAIVTDRMIFDQCQKEAEKAAQDAEAIRKRFLEVQGRANDAQAVAMETKREFERLRNKAEQAEIDAAAAASLREQDRKDEQERRKQSEPTARPPYDANGYQDQQYSQPQLGLQYGTNSASGLGQQSNYGYGNGGQQPGPLPSFTEKYGQMPSSIPTSQNSYGVQNSTADEGYEVGFSTGVMGGGGDRFDLPSPSQISSMPGGYSYDNPF